MSKKNKVQNNRPLSGIAEQKRAEEELLKSRENLQRVFESVTDGITITDLNGVITDVNEKVVEMHGFGSRDEVLGKVAFELIAPRDHKRAVANMRGALEAGSVEAVECTLLRVDGSEFLGELSVSVLKDVSDNPIGFIAVTKDINEKTKVTETLRESEEKFRSIFESASDGLIHLDKFGKILNVNKKAVQMYGASKRNYWESISRA